MIIKSLDNKLIKEYCKLNQKKYRDKNKMFMVEGFHLVEEAFKTNRLLKIILLEDEEVDIDIEKIYITKEIMKKLSQLDTPPNIIGICKIIENDNIDLGNKIVLLDNIQDPGNLGTIIRSSKAFNVSTIVLSNDTVDLYNPKVIRATQGIIFHINIIKRDLFEIITNLKNDSYIIFSTNVKDGVELKEINKVDKYALIMGNEGNGVKEQLQSLSDKRIYINMNNEVESLNVAVATSIILYELEK